MYAMITLPLAVDPFAVIILGGVGLLLLALILIGHFYPGSGADQVHWRSTRSYDQQVMNEIDDLDQMLEATNARRRRRGEPELTEGGLHARVREDMTDADKRRESYLAEQDLDQLLETKNERRARKGLPPVALEEYKAELEQG
jgi:uncharacterized protein YkwD